MTQSSQKDRNSVSLFPFLAVLICTMGALIVLLVIVVQQSRQAGKAAQEKVAAAASAQPVATTSPSPPEEPLDPDPNLAGMTPQQELEDLRWQIKQLEESRESTRLRVRDQQLQLSVVEDQIRELSRRLDGLNKEAEEFEAATSNRLQDGGELAAKSAEVQAQIEAVTAELAKARQEAQDRVRRFAIIPYQGPQGTTRRPIYLECLEDRAVLQPEGIVLVAADFPAQMGPDNALATILRATREYWLNHGVASTSGEAYPLMIVRSRGAKVYAVCRAALRGWDDEFGYELVPDDMQLQFPEPDPSLKVFLEQTLAETRERVTPQLASAGMTAETFANQPFGLGPEESADVSSFDDPRNNPRSNRTAARGSRGPADGSNGTGGSSGPGGLGGPGGPGDSSGPGDNGGTAMNAGGDMSGGGSSNEAEQFPAFPGAPSKIRAVHADAAAAPEVTSIAETRGENWALPNVAGHSIAISRPVAVVCSGGNLILEPDGDDAQAVKAFAFEGNTRSAVQPFVNALWNRIESWGVAGPSAYWKPVLKVAVEDPAGETRFADLSRLLEGSGLDVQRR